ncbi:hypothetical protein [uncultured Nostoc sp.]|uniref:hypothetical protein n=1 Tax=uncultured Nostoc sp. TaxID=340711 RepID=UPI0035C98671
MKIDIISTLTIISGLLGLIGAIYRLAQVEANINARISGVERNLLAELDAIKDDLLNKLNSTDGKIERHLVQYEGDKENIYIYRLNDNSKAIEHKFNRLANWITQIAALLYKQCGFQIQDNKF